MDVMGKGSSFAKGAKASTSSVESVACRGWCRRLCVTWIFVSPKGLELIIHDHPTRWAEKPRADRYEWGEITFITL